MTGYTCPVCGAPEHHSHTPAAVWKALEKTRAERDDLIGVVKWCRGALPLTEHERELLDRRLP